MKEIIEKKTAHLRGLLLGCVKSRQRPTGGTLTLRIIEDRDFDKLRATNDKCFLLYIFTQTMRSEGILKE